MTRHLRTAALVMLLSLHASPLVPAAAGQTGDRAGVVALDGLFRTARIAQPAVRPLGDEVVRTRQVTLDLRGLQRARDLPGARLRLNLFDDVALDGTVTRVNRPGVHIGFAETYAVSGTLDGIAAGSFHLVVHRGVVAGRVIAPRVGDFQVCYAGPGRHEVREIDPGKFAGCGTDAGLVVNAGGKSAAAPSALPKDDGSRIDVMLLYTPAARVEVGGTAAIEAEIMLAVVVGNDAYANSDIWTRLVIVYLEEVAYVETGSAFIELTRLSFSTDGFMDEIHAIRNTVAADNVGLFTDSSLNACGVAYLIKSFETNVTNSSFNVTAISCAVGNLTYVHEVGHNLGCAHERPVALPNEGAFPYSHGYPDPNLVFRTVMALPNGSPRVAHFSNPEITYADTGLVTGIPEGEPDAADNARTINQNAFFVASFKQTICPAPAPPVDCNNNCIDDFDDVAGGLVPDCNGNLIPDFCDVESGLSLDCNVNRVPDECEDCNANGVADSCEFSTTIVESSGALSPIGAGSPVQHTFASPPEPESTVTVRIRATADIGDFLRSMTVFLNNTSIGQIFRGSDPSCLASGAEAEIPVTAANFLALTGGPGMDAIVRVEASSSVNPFACAGTSSVTVELQYQTVGAAEDLNGNGLPDECDRAGGDINLDGTVNVVDLLALLGAWGPCPPPEVDPCHADVNRDGVVNVVDLLALLGGWS